MKKALILLCLLFMSVQCKASFLPNIPETTLQVAREAEIKAAFERPKSQIVRVGIGDNAFKSYDRTYIKVFGTAEMSIFANDVLVTEIPANKTVTVRIEDGKFMIADNEIIDEVHGIVRFSCKHGMLGIDGLKRAGSQALYRGDIELVKYKNGFHTVNVIEVEDYLKGVVPNEMPVRFGLEALKAQSVAARNYVLSPRTRAYDDFDVVDSVASQVYFGANSEKDLATKAVEETEGVVAIYGWDLILAQYSSTAGGYTESFANAFSDPVTKMFPSVPKPYLVAKPDISWQQTLDSEEEAMKFYKSTPDAYDMKSPYFRWQRKWTREELQRAIQTNISAQSATGFISPAFKKGEILGEVQRLDVVKRGESGKIIQLNVVTKNKTYKVYKELVIRRLLTNKGNALPSANVVFEHEFDSNGKLLSVTAYGGGFGHGVGLSQYGAGFMGTELGSKYYEILKHYYTGITLSTKPFILMAGNTPVSQTFYTQDKYAQIVVDNKYKLSYFLVNINGRDHKFDLSKKERVERIDISKYIKHGHNTVVFFYPQDEDANKGIRLFVELVKADE